MMVLPATWPTTKTLGVLPWRRWGENAQSFQDVKLQAAQAMVGMSRHDRAVVRCLRREGAAPALANHSPATAGGIADGSLLTSRHSI
jgi:hypothetical protein